MEMKDEANTSKKRKRKSACPACRAKCARTHKKSSVKDRAFCFFTLLEFPRSSTFLNVGRRTAERIAKLGGRKGANVQFFVEGPEAGQIWPLKLSLKEFTLVKGWSHFVASNPLLRAGDILLFTHLSRSHFVLRVFSQSQGHDGVEKFFQIAPENEKDKRKKQIVPIRFRERRTPCSSPCNIIRFPSQQIAYAPLSQAANCHPQFELALPTSAVSGTCRLNIPLSFSRHWLPNEAAKFKLWFPDHDETWWVTYQVHEQFRGFRWRRCALRNNLNVGDRCVFRLIDKTHYIFEVKIIRCLMFSYKVNSGTTLINVDDKTDLSSKHLLTGGETVFSESTSSPRSYKLTRRAT
eukprot:TRINITY_DN40365_c0_g1_i1.p1 TRINITY_DN40365_c0_g1~~TRINITY_DN40365_c0_g1_i1.p1  ORF type:complete len:350 (-),score=29.57 TRINITY_DN40365_c0_g1_i1:145-1194(-)